VKAKAAPEVVNPKLRAALKEVSAAEAKSVLAIEPMVWEQKENLELGLEFSIHYLTGPEAAQDAERVKATGVDPERLLASVRRFRELLGMARDAAELTASLRREFSVYKSIGYDGHGRVRFTGYFQPMYLASRVPDERFRFPIFKRPKDFDSWPEPHPRRWELEGVQGLGVDGRLAGQELAFLSSRFEAFMIHLQGSAILEMPNGERVAVGFDGATNHRFVGFSKTWLAERKISWTQLREFFAEHPHELDAYLMRNNRYIFFKENSHTLPVGSLGVPVIAEHSIATDKAMLIPGGLSILRTRFPQIREDGTLGLLTQTRIVLDQDTGSAIKGPGRADVFMGTGAAAQAAANKLYETGELYYLLLKDNQR
jgi:membrane-bound lytic murein transglycosylase A